MVLIIIFLIMIIVMTMIMVMTIYSIKFRNPYTLTLIYGKKGCGKTTVLQKLAHKHYKKGWCIFYNKGDSTFKNGVPIDCKRLWEYKFPAKSLLLIDEINLLWDNRQFKSFPKELGEWLRAQRHEKVKVIMFSQTADADKKIRDLTDCCYLCKRLWTVVIVCTPYVKDIVYMPPNEVTGVSGGFQDDWKKTSILGIGNLYTWLPYWVTKHDSFSDLIQNDEREVLPTKRYRRASKRKRDKYKGKYRR